MITSYAALEGNPADRWAENMVYLTIEHFFGNRFGVDTSCLEEELRISKGLVQSVFDKFPPRFDGAPA